ncbi:MAG: hypothetical protein HUU22_03420 [Phycisphaerae bacterium]|nr:hypothetical protein [Phycisphaerae bacterium]NUQ45066.1 hypothetical protein [Phycisphaerae bacterium]
MAQSTIRPTPIALVVCDTIYREQPGNKTALVGLFNNIRARSFPVTHPRMAVFASVTGLREGSRVKLEIVHGETDRLVVVAEGPLPDGATPTAIADLNFVLTDVVFPEEGRYYIRFWGNDHLLLMRPFDVRRIRGQGGEHES